MDIQYDLRLSYGVPPEPQLNGIAWIHEHQFKNTSQSYTYTLDFYGGFYLESYHPPDALIPVALPSYDNAGMPAGPSQTDLVILKPGQIHKVIRWYWPSSQTHFSNKKEGKTYNHTGKLVDKMNFCWKFDDSRSALFVNSLKLSSPPRFDSGTVCTTVKNFEFKNYN